MRAVEKGREREREREATKDEGYATQMNDELSAVSARLKQLEAERAEKERAEAERKRREDAEVEEVSSSSRAKSEATN